MWCPSASLSVWANAWLAGRAAPDDVLDALSAWAPHQSVVAHDAVAAGSTGLSWPARGDLRAASLLQTVRGAAGTAAVRTIHPVFPVPGDARGLPAGTDFERAALAVGEAVIVTGPGSTGAVGLVPDSTGGPVTLSWTVHALPAAPATEQHDLGELEYALRSAVRSAAAGLTAIGSGYPTAPDADPRSRVEALLESVRQHRIPNHAPPRALRVLDQAAQIDAIVAVGSRLHVAHCASAAQRTAEALRPLAGLVRSARTAATEVILGSAWQR